MNSNSIKAPDYKSINVLMSNVYTTEATIHGTAEKDGWIRARTSTEGNNVASFIRITIDEYVVFDEHGVSGMYRYQCSPLIPVKKEQQNRCLDK